jgi:hypothetical protein
MPLVAPVIKATSLDFKEDWFGSKETGEILEEVGEIACYAW